MACLNRELRLCSHHNTHLFRSRGMGRLLHSFWLLHTPYVSAVLSPITLPLFLLDGLLIISAWISHAHDMRNEIKQNKQAVKK
ncbi:hypothetical protein ccbrp13_00110 [Ktedonobacteria bacterium brp13]|nr:hypothetical protein ccbrp13_00110 [Ktedonobacteria bacterium brp13]